MFIPQDSATPPPTATVSVQYAFWLEGQDEPFDATALRGKPETIREGEGKKGARKKGR